MSRAPKSSCPGKPFCVTVTVFRLRIATPFHAFCPWRIARYPSASRAAWGNLSSVIFSSCSPTRSGRRSRSQRTRRSSRARSPLTFQVAIRIPSSPRPALFSWRRECTTRGAADMVRRSVGARDRGGPEDPMGASELGMDGDRERLIQLDRQGRTGGEFHVVSLRAGGDAGADRSTDDRADRGFLRVAAQNLSQERPAGGAASDDPGGLLPGLGRNT